MGTRHQTGERTSVGCYNPTFETPMNSFQKLHRLRLVLCALILFSSLLAPLAALAEERGPSTPEERAKAIELTRKLETDPLNPQAEG